MSRIGKNGGTPCRASRVTYRRHLSSSLELGAARTLNTTDPLPIPIGRISRHHNQARRPLNLISSELNLICKEAERLVFWYR